MMIFFLIFSSIQSADIKVENNNKGTLIESQYVPWANSGNQFIINNLFDDDDSNCIHSAQNSPINDNNPFIVLVDMGEVISANMYTIYGSFPNGNLNYYYQPKRFVLYVGMDKDNLEIVSNVGNALRNNNDITNSFSTKSFRYYKLVVTETFASNSNYISYRCLKFSLTYPMATPNPQRTQYPGTVDTYINKNFNGSVGIEQVHAGINNIKQISGCRFTNIHDTERNYYFRIRGETIIFDNIFENTEFITEPKKAGVFWNDYTGKVTISNCKFIRISGKGGEGYVFTSASSVQIQVTMDRCDFIDCGQGGGTLQLISLLDAGNSIKLYGCKFTFSTSRVCGVLELRSNDCLIDHCQFIGCAADTILLSNRAGSNEQPVGTFEFTNNQVTNNKGKFINAVRLLNKPIIDNNIFESTTLSDGYFIQLPNNQEVIELNNNTFSQISSSGTQDKSCGGVGIFIESTNSEFTIKYNKCKFYDITNDQSTYPNCQGGAIQYGFSDNSNLNCHLEITNCEFKGNKVKRHGGAIAIRTAKSVLIQNCKFESNLANNDNSNNNGELLFTNHYEDKTKGVGGSIYLNPTFNLNGNDHEMTSISISGCTFKNNAAYQGYAIYLGGEESSTIISISSNTFDGNKGAEDSPNNGGIICSELATVDSEVVISSNRFYSIGTSERFSYVDYAGNMIPKPIPKPTRFPGTVDTFINKVFTGSVGSSQVQIGTENINQISGCRFTNIAVTDKNYYLKINSETIIFDNIFENTEFIDQPERAGIFWNVHSGKITLSNCTFTKISGRGGEGYVFTSNGACHNHVIMDRCNFVDCGKAGSYQLISILSQQSSIKFYGCKFTFSTSRVCGVLELRTNDCLFDHCQFTGCAADTILLSNRAGSNEQPVGTFEFTNNQVTNNKGKFINAVRLLNKPIIDNNIFESTTLSDGYFIQLPNNQEVIELNNNTFSQISSSGTQDKSCGGVGIFIESTNSEFTIKYNKCKFYDITNDQSAYPNCQGGAIQYGFSDNSNLNCHLEITNCEFKGNKVKRHGGAIAIRTAKSVLIQNCKFESNLANNDNSNNNGELLFTNHYEDKTKGVGGSIYLNPTFNLNGNDHEMTSISISGCTFKNNAAYQGYAIYLGGEESSTIISISSNTFDGNKGAEDSPNNGGIICSELATVDSEVVISSNRFYSIGTSERFSYVDYAGNMIPKPIPKPTRFPGTVDTFINKVFTGSVGSSQVQIGTENINQISGCRFTNIAVTDKNYYLKINSETIIFDNIFENTEFIDQPERAGIFWNVHSGKITLSNCTFTKISGRGGEGYVFTSNGACHNHVIMDRCNFVDCGKAGSYQLISILSQQSSIKFYGCKFTFSTSRVCGVLELRTNDCLFDHCQFTGCAADTILLSNRAGSNEQPVGTFEFTNNQVTNNKGKFINAVRLLNKPIIDNNIFESTTLSGGYFIQLPNNQEVIELNNNTFSQISSSGTQDKSCGGVGIFIESTNSEFTIKYNKCKFYDITNDQSTYPNCQGGAIQYGFSDNSNLNCHLEITNCEFKGNKVKRHGGAIAIRTAKSVLIQNCKFESNLANNDNSNNNGELLFTNHYEDKTKGVGGSIYLNPTFNLNGNDHEMTSISISGCTFKNNAAYQGYAIYLGGEESSTIISISSNTFDGNKGDSYNGGIICSEITSVSDETVINSNKFTNIGRNERFCYVDHTGNTISKQFPKPTPYPGTVDTFINKVFTGSVGSSQVQIGTGNINQISGCRFTNIAVTDRNYYLKINSETIIFDNIFENTEFIDQPERAGIFWNVHSGKITLSNCTFTKISGRGGEGYVFTSNGACHNHVIMDRCNFVDCGKAGSYQLISILSQQSSIKFYGCKFTFSTSRVCGVLELRTNDCLFDHCQFTGCAADTILLSNRAGSNEQPVGTFEFTNNQVTNNKGKFINAVRLLNKPIIDNNIFESTTLSGGYFIQLPNNQEVIELNYNTFSQISSSGTQDKSCGGVGIFIESTNSEFTIKYHECKFYDITNDQSTYPNCQGGAIQYGFSDNSNLNCHLEITNCEFKGNKVKRHGGAIAIRTAKSVLIQNCKFESNLANNVDGSSKLLSEDTNGFGGSIYVNPSFSVGGTKYEMSSLSISGCDFKDNHAYQGYAIYIEGEDSDTTVYVNNNIFEANSNTPDSTVEGSVVCSELQTVSKKTILGANTFVGGDTENTIGSFNFVDNVGQPIPEDEQPPDLTMYNYSNSTSNGRIDIEEEMKQTVLVIINISSFTSINNVNGDGGAIRVINTGIQCNDTNFTSCSSTKAGGAIYLFNSYPFLNSMTIGNNHFNGNTAQYGGALYIYSVSSLNLVTVAYCNFENNHATAAVSTTAKYGGSGAFITARSSIILNNHFSDNQGPGPDLRIYNRYSTTLNDQPIKNANLGHIIISNCMFEIGKNSQSSLFYDHGNDVPSIELVDCEFSGNLAPGSHFIDGHAPTNNNSPKLAVKGCKFDSNVKDALNLDPNNSFMTVDLKDQIFSIKTDETTMNKKQNDASKIFVTVAASAVAVLVVLVLVVVKKRYQNDQQQDDQHETNDL